MNMFLTMEVVKVALADIFESKMNRVHFNIGRRRFPA